MRPPILNPYEGLFKAICDLESGGDIFALNLNEQACGIAQIRPIRLFDYNRLSGENLKTWDCFDPEVSRRVFMFFCKGSLERTARAWNGSGEMTDEYWEQIKARL